MWTKALFVFTLTAVAARPQQQQQLSGVIEQALNSEAVQSVLKDIQELSKSFQSSEPFEGIKRLNSVAFDAAVLSSPPANRQNIQDSQDLVNSILDTVGNFIQNLPSSVPSSGSGFQETAIVPDLSSVNKLIQDLSALNGTSTIPVQIPAIPPINIPGFPPIQIPKIPPIQIPDISPIQIPQIPPIQVPAINPASTQPANAPGQSTSVGSDSSGFPEEYQEP